ncbi:OmpA family protein [Nevskia sp.]|uniref:OmpA family protein n=1 Tax=Nevskia sp. TaxID=1929292 RepID=UPI0025D9F78A|nr:OmpA family protein [Nevskia sp.]
MIAPSVVHAADEVLPFYFAPMGSYVFADDGRGTKDGIGGTVAVGAHLGRNFDLELLGSYIKFGAKDQQSSMSQGAGGIGANIYLFRTDAGSGLFIHGDVLGSGKTYYHYGLGYDLMVGKYFGIRAEGLIRNQQFEHHEPQVNIGLRIPFGSNPPKPAMPAPPLPPPPVEVVAVEAPAPPPPPPPCTPPAAGQAISLDGCKKGDNIVLRGVNFEFDKAVLTPNATVLLDQVSEALTRRPDIKVEIGGHTDAKGSVKYNKKLSDARAASVRTYLMQKGISADRMTSVGYGKIVAIASNDTDEGRALNRRVELTVTDSNPEAGAVESLQPGAPPEITPGAESAPADTALAAVIAPSAAPVAAASATAAVSIIDYEYSPKTVTVLAGGTVTWTNNDRVTHTVTFSGEDIKIKQGESFTKSYPAAGTFEYKCGIHPTMFGTVVVVAP